MRNGIANSSFQHNDNGYERHGCRCDICTSAHNERIARNRADRLASRRLSHGTRSAWDAGCRCEPCTTVKRAAWRDYYLRKTTK